MEAKTPEEGLIPKNCQRHQRHDGVINLTSAEAIEKLESEDIWKSLPRDGNQSPVPRIREAKIRRSEPF